MNYKWLLVVIAAIFEVGWAAGLKYADSFSSWTFTVIAIFVSFALLIKSAMTLPTSTVYAIFVGLGTVGTVMVDILFFEAPLDFWLLFFIVLLLIGTIGLKMATGDKNEGSEAS